MNEVVIRVENVSKEYRLGVIGHGTLSHDLQSKWARFWGREDPNTRIDNKFADSRKNEQFQALQNVSFEVRRGEIVGIIGRNGAGKSTLLKILSRVTAPTSGSIKVKGRIASLLEVGTGFHPELTGRENVFLNGAILGMTRGEIEDKFDDIVRFAEIERFIDTPVKRYSSGMYVRLAFAVAAHLESEILVVDEVLAVGDASFQKKCLGKMGNIAKEGRTVLFVSHNMGAVNDLCTKGILIDNGMISSYGEIREVLDNYLNRFLFLSNTPLSLRCDRSGEGGIRIKNITYGLDYQEKCGFWVTGKNCVVNFEYQIKTDYVDSSVDIGFSIVDNTGRNLFYANTIVTKKHLSLSKKEGIISCKIENFPLSCGKYFLTYDLYCDGILVDKVQNACVIMIEERDFIDTWKSWGGYGTICARYSWDVC